MRRKVLIVDDTESIHRDFQAVLAPPEGTRIRELSRKVDQMLDLDSGEKEPIASEVNVSYDLDFAFQGEEAIRRIDEAARLGDPFALVFMDVRMPPGMNGIETIREIRKMHPLTEFVICTAYSDYSLEKIIEELGITDKVLFLPKPFDPMVVKQLAISQTTKFNLHRELMAQRNQLEKEVVEQAETVDRQNRKLVESLDKLQKLQARLVDREKMASMGTLAAGIAHELNNPLSFIQNFSEAMNEISREIIDLFEQVPDHAPGRSREIRDHLAMLEESSHKIRQHAIRADGIIKSMQNQSRGERSSKELIPLHPLLSEFLESSYENFRLNHPSFQCRMERDFDMHIGDVHLAEQDFSRVMINILTNAFFAMKEKQSGQGETYHPELKITTERDGERAKIVILDNGTGIPESHLDDIFKPFYTTRPPGEGTGLGLPICRSIIEEDHHGDFTVSSKQGEHTAFTILLPLRQTCLL